MGKNKTAKQSNPKQKSDDDHQRKKSKRNGKPTPTEHLEHVPFRLREIMRSKERMKLGRKNTKKAVKATSKVLEGDIPVPQFRRRERESEKAFLRRMSRETNHVMFLTKNQVERQPEMDDSKQEHEAGKRKSEKKKEHDKERLQRLHQKKLERREDRDEKEMFEDKVEFGEVAMAPPTLSAKPRKAPNKSKVASQGLLLTSLLGQTAVSVAKPSMARQRIMEEERVRVVEAYRLLKKQKQEQKALQARSIGKLLNPQ